MPPEKTKKSAFLLMTMIINKALGKKLDDLAEIFRAGFAELKQDKQANRIIAEALGSLRSLESLKGLSKLSEWNDTLKEAVSEIERIAADRPSIDIREGNRLLKQLMDKMPRLDTTKMESGLIRLGEKLDKLSAKDDSAVRELLADLKDAVSRIKIPETVKLSDMDLRTIRSSGGGVVVAGGGGPMLATKALVANVSLTAATEGSYAFPRNTVGFHIKARNQNVLIQYAWTSGESNTTYMTIPQNGLYSRPDTDFTGKTIYLYAASAQTVEIEVYTA